MKKYPVSIFLLVILLAFLFYLPGIAQAPLPGDSAIYVARAKLLYLNSYAQTHPLHIWLSHFWINALPLNPVYSMGILSAIFGALTVGLVFELTTRLKGTYWAGAAAGGSLMVSHTLWFHSVFPEVYTLNTFFQALVMLCCLQWHRSRRNLWLTGVFLAAGVGSANHLLMGLTMVPVSIWILVVCFRRKQLSRALPFIFAGTILGILPLGYWFIGDVADLGWRQAVKMALVGGGGVKGGQRFSYGHAMFNFFDPWIFKQFALSIGFGIYNFVGFAFLLSIAGFFYALKNFKGLTILLSMILGIHFLFGVSYHIHEHWAFLLPCWVVVAVFAGVGFTTICDSFRMAFRILASKNGKFAFLAVLLVVPPVTYALIPAFINVTLNPKKPMVSPMQKYALMSYKEKLIFQLWPPKTNASTQAREIQHTIEGLPPGSVLFLRPSDNAIAYCLQIVGGLRPDIVVTGNSKDHMLACLKDGKRIFVKDQKEARKISTLGYDIHFKDFNEFAFEVVLDDV